LTKIIESMGKYYREAKDKSTDSIKTLLLYLTQILTSLSLLINIFVEEEELKLAVVVSKIVYLTVHLTNNSLL
jgi:hypothetical protein